MEKNQLLIAIGSVIAIVTAGAIIVNIIPAQFLTTTAQIPQSSTSICGNSIVEAGEQCDPPGGNAFCGAGVCQSNCLCSSPIPSSSPFPSPSSTAPPFVSPAPAPLSCICACIHDPAFANQPLCSVPTVHDLFKSKWSCPNNYMYNLGPMSPAQCAAQNGTICQGWWDSRRLGSYAYCGLR